MVQNRNLMEPTVDNIPEFKLCDFFLGLNAKSVVQLNRKKNISNGKQHYLHVWIFWEKVS